MFYPPPPEEPRIQFLTSFQSSRDIEGEGGGLLKFVVGEEEKFKPIVKPYGVALRNGKIYLADTVSNVLEVIDLEQNSFDYLKPKGNTELKCPINLEIAPDGRILVADSALGQVLILDTEGKIVGVLGSKNELKPTDVAIWDNKIYVCDLESHSVRIYDLGDLNYLSSIPKDGQGDEAKLFSPTNLDFDSSGNLYVSDTGAFNVKKYSADGMLLKIFGSHGDALGQLARNKGIAVDREGRLYVVDAAFENIQIFNQEGKLLLFFPSKNDPAALVLPAGIFIDYDHVNLFSPFIAKDFEVEYLILVVSQYGDRKLSIFGYGHKK